MTLRFTPKAVCIAIGQFPASGMAVGAEMVKTRPVIVVSRVLRGRHGVANVVPVSMTSPKAPRRWHVVLPVEAMPHGWREKPGARWAKCDMLTLVSLDRLSMPSPHREHGRKRFHGAELDAATLRQVRDAIAYVLELI